MIYPYHKQKMCASFVSLLNDLCCLFVQNVNCMLVVFSKKWYTEDKLNYNTILSNKCLTRRFAQNRGVIMGNTFPLACSWPLLDGAKKILEEGDQTVNSINSLLHHIKETLHLSGVSIRQRIPRPYSLRIMYEHMKNSPIRRINQTITYTPEEWDTAVNEYKKGYYVHITMTITPKYCQALFLNFCQPLLYNFHISQTASSSAHLTLLTFSATEELRTKILPFLQLSVRQFLKNSPGWIKKTTLTLRKRTLKIT